MHDPFKELERALRILQEEERRAERKAKNLADWSDPSSKREYIREYKRLRRRRMLPDDMTCPCCKEVKTKSRSWMIFHRARIVHLDTEPAKQVLETFKGVQCAVCRACAMKHFVGTLWKKGEQCSE